MTMSTQAIYASLANILAEIEPIQKNKKGHQYMFRGIDDVLNTLHPLFASHKVMALPTVEDIVVADGITTLKVNYRLLSLTDGSEISFTSIGQGKGTDDKSTNKAMSGAFKAGFLQVFCIPTEDIDDADNHQAPPVAKPTAVKPQPSLERVPVDKNFEEVKQALLRLAAAKGIKGGINGIKEATGMAEIATPDDYLLADEILRGKQGAA